jgi:hypothetical protein
MSDDSDLSGSGSDDEPVESGPEEEEDRPATAGHARVTKEQKKAAAQWEAVFAEWPTERAKALSRAERAERNMTHSSLVYGETPFRAVWAAFDRLHALGVCTQGGGNFYDFGSGTGKATLAAVLAHDFHKCRGLEVLAQLHGASMEVLERWNATTHAALPPAKQRCDVRFLNQDIAATEWRDATFVFASCACFNEQLMRTIAEKGEECRAGCIFVGVAKRIDDERHWELLDESEHEMSWGPAPVYIQRRRTAEEELGAALAPGS